LEIPSYLKKKIPAGLGGGPNEGGVEYLIGASTRREGLCPGEKEKWERGVVETIEHMGELGKRGRTKRQ